MYLHSTVLTARGVRAGLLVVAAMMSVGCGGGDGGTGPKAPAGIRLESSTASVYQGLSAFVDGVVGDNAKLSGSLNGEVVHVRRVDDTTLVFLVPDVESGSYSLSLSIDNKEFVNALTVTALSVPADPAGYVQRQFDSQELVLDSLEVAYVDPAARPIGLDYAAFQRDIARNRERLAEALQQHAALNADEKATVAAILAVNNIDDLTSAGQIHSQQAGSRSVLLLPETSGRSGSGFVLTSTHSGCNGANWSRHGSSEQCLQKSFVPVVTGRQVERVKNAATAVFCGLAMYAAAALGSKHKNATVNAGNTVIVAAVNTLLDVNQEVADSWSLPVLGEVYGLEVQSADGPYANVRSSDGLYAPHLALKSVVPDTFYHDTEDTVVMAGRYRSPTTADLSRSSALRDAARDLGEIATIWNNVQDSAEVESEPATVPTTSKVDTILPIPPQYLSIEAVAPAAIKVDARITPDSQWVLKFRDSVRTIPTKLDFTVRYKLPGYDDETVRITSAFAPLSIVGTYILKTYNGATLPTRLLPNPDVELLSGSVVLRSDSTYTLNDGRRYMDETGGWVTENDSESGTWRRTNSTITLSNVDGLTGEVFTDIMTISGSTLTYVYTRQREWGTQTETWVYEKPAPPKP